MKEIAGRYDAIAKKYGPEAIYNHMSSGQQGPFQRGGGNGASSVFAAVVGPLSGGYLHQGYNYSAHSASYFGTAYTGVKGTGNRTQHMASNTTSLFLWGYHILTSSNPYSYSAILSAQAIKDRGGKIYYISPTLEDTGITLATDWVQLNPLTDVALITAMIHEMIVNTFKADGSLENDPWLDVDYLDSMVYGFFASPEYWIDSAGNISLDNKDGDPSYVRVDAVPAGQSYADYIMGQDGRLSNARYGTPINGKVNYNSRAFAGIARGGKCTLCADSNVGPNASFYYKQTVREEKTAGWAEKITGVPASEITAMAKRICDDVKAGNSVMHTCSNGWQRNAEGVNYLFALQNLVIISKGWGRNGAGYFQGAAYNAHYIENPMSTRTSPMSPKTANASKSNYANTVPKLPSCTMWHAGVKFAFGDQLKQNGYTGKYVPDMDMNKLSACYAYHGDANIKSFVKHTLSPEFRNKPVQEYVDIYTSDKRYEVGDDGYYKYEIGADGKPVASGIRFVYTAAGNAIINQHMNSNDTAEMLECLPFNPNEADADAFCYIALDTNFSPTMRWADYALPGTANWEMTDFITGAGSSNKIYMPKVIDGPGESKSTYEMNKMLSRALYEIDPSAYGYLNDCFGKNEDTPDDRIKEAFETAIVNANEDDKRRWPDYEAFKKDGYILNLPSETAPDLAENAILTGFENYKNNTDMTGPFLTYYSGGVISTFDGNECRTGTGNNYKHYIVDPNDPKPSKRFHVLSNVMVWEYRHRNEKFHGYLPVEERGNKNDDGQGDPVVYPIPVYFDYRDYFKEAYGTDLFAEVNEARKPLFNLGTHIRYRSHSTFNDSPLVRELGKAAIGGGIALDTAEFAVVLPENNPPIDFPDKPENYEDTSLSLKRLTPIGKAGCGYEKLWMNEEDANIRGIRNGDLVKAWNPIGAVYAVACVSKRIAKGVTLLPQGGWYDPDPVSGIDAGGCANTIVSSVPTRCDHGNAQMSIAIIVERA